MFLFQKYMSIILKKNVKDCLLRNVVFFTWNMEN